MTDRQDPAALFHVGEDLPPAMPERAAWGTADKLRAWQQAPGETVHANTLQRVLHTLKGSARMAGAMRLGQHAHEIETHVESMANAGVPVVSDGRWSCVSVGPTGFTVPVAVQQLLEGLSRGASSPLGLAQ